MFTKVFFRKTNRFWDNVKKYGTAREATGDSIVHAHCMLDIWGYIHAWTRTHTHSHSECVILIAFPRQQWLCERPSMLHLYLYCVSPSSLRTPAFHYLEYPHILFLFLANTLAVTCLYCTCYSLYFFILIELSSFLPSWLNWVVIRCTLSWVSFVWLYLFVNVLLFTLFKPHDMQNIMLAIIH